MTVSYCVSCGNRLIAGTRFCTRCGTPVQPGDASEATQGQRGAYPGGAVEGRTILQRFQSISESNRFLATAGPVLIWYGAAVALVWTVIGLLSLRFDIGAHIELPNLLFSMLIMVGIVLTTTANYYLVHSYRERSGPRWHTFSYLPFIWGASIGAGLLIMILQVWTDFAWGPDDLRMTMFSLIGVGLCGTYGGYLALIVVGRERIFEITRVVAYILLAIIAVEILEATWMGSQNMTGQEMMEHFITAGWTATVVVVVYSTLAAFLAQTGDRKGSNHCSGCVRSAWASGVYYRRRRLVGQFPRGCNTVCPRRDSLRVHHYIGLLLVQHFHEKFSDGPNLPSGGAGSVEQSGP